MQSSYEFKGKNVEKAIEIASEELNIAPEKIKYEVLTYGSTGIFGLVGAKKAVIKVIVENKKTPIKSAPVVSTDIIENNFNSDNESFEEDINVDEDAGQILDYGMEALKRIINEISEDATIEAKQTKDKILFTVTGGDSGILIGKRGQTLEGIQYILEKIINKKTNKKIRIMVDIEGYLEKRKSNLKKLATRMAEKARKIKKPVTIGQMNAHERRIVHLHLKDERGIRTQSIGEGYYRKLMIFPKRQGSSKPRNSKTKI